MTLLPAGPHRRAADRWELRDERTGEVLLTRPLPLDRPAIEAALRRHEARSREPPGAER